MKQGAVGHEKYGVENSALQEEVVVVVQALLISPRTTSSMGNVLVVVDDEDDDGVVHRLQQQSGDTGDGSRSGGSGECTGSGNNVFGNILDLDIVLARAGCVGGRAVSNTRVLVHHVDVGIDVVGIGGRIKVEENIHRVKKLSLDFSGGLFDGIHGEGVFVAEVLALVGFDRVPAGVRLVFGYTVRACRVGTLRPVFVNCIGLTGNNIESGVGSGLGAVFPDDIVGNAEGSVIDLLDAQNFSGVKNISRTGSIELGERDRGVE